MNYLFSVINWNIESKTFLLPDNKLNLNSLNILFMDIFAAVIVTTNLSNEHAPDIVQSSPLEITPFVLK